MTMELTKEEWEALKTEMEDLKKEVSAMKRSNRKDLKTLKHESEGFQGKLKERIDGLEIKLMAGKQKLNSETRKTDDLSQRVERLKRTLNRRLVSGHQKRNQALTLPTPPATTSAFGRTSPSPHGTSGMVPQVNQLSEEGKERLRQTSSFNAGMTAWRHVQAGAAMRVDGYDVVDDDSNCLNAETGVYTTPVKGRYRFSGYTLSVKGKGDVMLYVCESDGRRKKLEGGCEVNNGWWGYDDVDWDCREGLTVWLEVKGGKRREGLTVWVEVKGGKRRDEIKFSARFVGCFLG